MNVFFIFFIAFSFSFNLGAQNTDLLTQELFQGIIEGDIQTERDADEDFVYVENNFKTLDRIDKAKEQQAFFLLNQEKRIKAATELCAVDSRACYLIENYRKYKDELNEKTPKEDDLKLYGIDIFSNFPMTFDVIDNTAIDPNYVISTGDTFEIVIRGPVNNSNKYRVNRDGKVNIERVGTVNVGGLTYQSAINEIKDKTRSVIVGSEADVTIFSQRDMGIYIFGNTQKPGIYRVGAQASVLSTLNAVGGLKEKSSLRTVQVANKSSGKTSIVDLYKTLIYGDINNTLLLNDGDSVLVNALESSIKIMGAVNRPAEYEILQKDTLLNAIDFALGFKTNALSKTVSVKRRNKTGEVLVINVSAEEYPTFYLENGDVIVVNEENFRIVDNVTVIGNVQRPGLFKYQPNSKLYDYIDFNSMLDDTYKGFGILRSYSPIYGWDYTYFNLFDKNQLDLPIKPKDEIYILSSNDVDFIRSEVLNNYIEDSLESYKDDEDNIDPAQSEMVEKDEMASEELLSTRSNCLEKLDIYLSEKFASNFIQSAKIFKKTSERICPDLFQQYPYIFAEVLENLVPISGDVRKPGLYPLSNSINPQIGVRIAGGAWKKEYLDDIEFKSYRDGSLQFINLNSRQSNLVQRSIRLVGEFNKPGTYIIDSNTRLSDVYKMAGGVSDSAYPFGGILTRLSLIESEKKALEKSSQELADLLSTAITSGVLKQDSADLLNILALMERVNNVEASGRLVTNLDPFSLSDGSNDIVLMDGDTIYMPQRPNSVTITGNVLNPISVKYIPSFTQRDYIELAGGFKDNADPKSTFIILPNGESMREDKGLFSRNKYSILPGSTIIVPRKARPLSGLGLVEVIAPTLANLSVTAASIAAISDN